MSMIDEEGLDKRRCKWVRLTRAGQTIQCISTPAMDGFCYRHAKAVKQRAARGLPPPRFQDKRELAARRRGVAHGVTPRIEADSGAFALAGPSIPVDEAAATASTSNVPPSNTPVRASQRSLLVELALRHGAKLWHTTEGEPYITITNARDTHRHHEHHSLKSSAARDWLARLHFSATRSTCGAQALRDALATLCGHARYDGAQHEAVLRVGEHLGCIYLDLGANDWSAVEIDVHGWRITENPPVRFRRPRGLLPLPRPLPGGSLDDLRALMHVDTSDDWLRLVSWLMGALRPKGPYPLLELVGEQDSSKSTTARMLRRTIDPSTAILRSNPAGVRDLMVAASGAWILALDNLARLPRWLSDALCRLSTGGALGTRQLFTDGEEFLIDAMRPAILTGIDQVVRRGDLQSRAITVGLPPIADRVRRTEAELWKEYDRKLPVILGALLEATATALRREPAVRPPDLPRMADWARWVTAAEPALGCRDGDVLRAHRVGRTEALECALEGDPLAMTIRKLTRPWRGTASQILESMRSLPGAPHHWSPRKLAGELRVLAPQFRALGIHVTFGARVGHERQRIIQISEAATAATTTARTMPAGIQVHRPPADAAERSPHAYNDLHIGGSPADDADGVKHENLGTTQHGLVLADDEEELE